MRVLQGTGDGLGEVADPETVSLCSLSVGDGVYGIATARVREVLGKRDLRRVPLAPSFVAGVVSYRGEVLTAVSFRALLGLEPRGGKPGNCVIVLEEAGDEARFGLVVDGVGGVTTVEREALEANPGTLDARSEALFDGAYRMAEGLIVHLDPDRLRPSRLAESELFGYRNRGGMHASTYR